MKKLIPYLFFLALCCGWVSAQTINYTPPQFALATSSNGHAPYAALTTASGLGQVSFTPTFFVPMCSSTGAPPYSQCTFSGGGSTITCVTSGGIVYWNGTAYVCVGAGTARQVLTWPTSGSVPAWQTPSSGALVLLEEHTASNSASLNFTTCISSTYDLYQIELVNVLTATNETDLVWQASTNGGTSYDVTSGHYSWSGFVARSGGSAAGGNATDPDVNLLGILGDTNNTAADGGTSGTFKISNPLSGVASTSIVGQSGGTDPGSSQEITALVKGRFIQTTAVTAFRIVTGDFGTGGTIVSGTVRCYGIAH